MEEFVARHDIGHMPHIADSDGRIWQQFGVVAQPAWVFVDAGTGSVERVLGALSTADLQARIDALDG